MQEVPGSRQRMIEAAIELMRGSGLSGAGINEIVRESAAPKGSVYHFFPNGKQQVVTEALETGRRQDACRQGEAPVRRLWPAGRKC
jgi:TetR/AcrR family transcriptional regulator, lmrAB and yxaGH operons repressor